MRQIFSRAFRNLRALRITAEEPIYRGETPHRYVIDGFDTTGNRAARGGGYVPSFRELMIIFADEDGRGITPDGVTIDSLLAVVADHLYGKVIGPSSTQAQRLALDYIEQARTVLDEDDGFGSRRYSPPFQTQSLPL